MIHYLSLAVLVAGTFRSFVDANGEECSAPVANFPMEQKNLAITALELLGRHEREESAFGLVEVSYPATILPLQNADDNDRSDGITPEDLALSSSAKAERLKLALADEMVFHAFMQDGEFILDLVKRINAFQKKASKPS